MAHTVELTTEELAYVRRAVFYRASQDRKIAEECMPGSEEYNEWLGDSELGWGIWSKVHGPES